MLSVQHHKKVENPLADGVRTFLSTIRCRTCGQESPHSVKAERLPSLAQGITVWNVFEDFTVGGNLLTSASICFTGGATCLLLAKGGMPKAEATGTGSGVCLNSR